MHIGVDLGGTNIGVGIVKHDGSIIAQIGVGTNAKRPFNEICKDIISLIHNILNDNNYKCEDIKSIGIGLPGVVDVKKGIFVWAPNIMVDSYPLREVLEKEFDVKTYLDNDAKCAALAESRFGSTKDYDNSVTITIGTGIGVGIITNKQIYRGLNNTAGEFGHMIINMEGHQCSCGRKGCWEQYASSFALRRMAISEAIHNINSQINVLSGWDTEKITGRMVWEASDKGDVRAQDLIKNYIRYIGEGIVNIVNAVDTEIIAIGGGVSRQKERLTDPIKEYVQKNIYYDNRKMVEITTAKFGREAGIIGAAILSE